MKNLILLATILFFLPCVIFAQGYTFEWAKQLGGLGNDVSKSLAIDKSGNCYTIGYFSGTADFDPGPNVNNLTQGGNGIDIFIQKSDAFGNLVWVKQMQGVGNAIGYGYSIVVDSFGNIYSIGAFLGTVDFDPGPNVYPLTSDGNNTDIYIQKLDAFGNFTWARKIGGANVDYGYSIAVDQIGNVYSTGEFKETADFDPGPGIFNLISAGGKDIFIQKLNASGNFVWAKGIGGALDDKGNSIAVDRIGTVYATGQFSDTVDFNPSTSTTILTSGGSFSTFISKLSPSGDFIWAKQVSGPGYSAGSSITIDPNGAINLTGFFKGACDFDPGIDANLIVSAGQGDAFIEKLDTTGNLIWVKTIGNAGPNCIVTDLMGNIYVAGVFGGSTDFDPGIGVYNVGFSGFLDLFMLKLDMNGNFLWAAGTGSSNAESIESIAVNSNGNIYATGTFRASVDFDPSSEINILDAGGSNNYDVFVCKFSQFWDFHGTVFRDLNFNQIKDTNETGLSSIILTTLNSKRSTSTDSLGNYHIYNDIVGDTLIAVMPRPHWLVAPLFAIPDTTQHAMNFAVEMEGEIHDVSITAIEKTPFRPGFETELTIHVTNYSTVPIDLFFVTLDSFNLPTPLVFLSAEPAPDYIMGNLLTWKLDSLDLLNTQIIRVRFLTPSTINNGAPIDFPVRAILINDNFPADNLYQVKATVVGSYDPNDKQVVPQQTTPYALDSTVLRYVIRFQNTGNYPADFVYILDTLSSDLDLSSLQIISTSHPYAWRLYNERILEVAFNPIILPDAFTDEPNSHGFVAFTVKPKKDLIEGDWISNRASIYFDYNSSIVTNSAILQVVETVRATDANHPPCANFDLSPNPASKSSKILINFPFEICKDLATKVIVTNQLGETIKEISHIRNDQSIFLTGLPSGIYIVAIINENLRSAKLLIVE